MKCFLLSHQSFWSYMNLLLRPLVSGKPAAEQFTGLPAHCKDPLGFTWWLVTHLAVLGQYSHNGTNQNEVREEGTCQMSQRGSQVSWSCTNHLVESALTETSG